jgi:ABC-type lipoprotein export system ATPase subunit
MQITLRNFIPQPLVETSHTDSDIWEKDEIVFNSNSTYLITAPSGKGKTSLISMIYGIRKDYIGKITIDGTDISLFNLIEWSEFRKKKISCIFQGLELFDELTALENIQLKNRILDYNSGFEIMEMARVLEMDTYLNRAAGKLSFGQRQRIAIIRALCQPFEFLLADEIFSHLDKKLEKLSYDLIMHESRKNKAGMLLTSLHPIEEYSFDIHFMI